jgi:hypothetical protein
VTRIPPHYLDAVAVLEVGQMGEDAMAFQPVATATIFGYALEDQSGIPEGAIVQVPVLVTNKHVVEDLDELYIRFNQGSGSSSERFRMVLKLENEDDLFRASERYDIAVTPFPGDAVRKAGADFTPIPEVAMLDFDGLKSKHIAGGDTVFTLGFPMGLAGDERKYAIVRAGVVARLDQEIVEKTGGFLIDCAVFPGNSGGPVVLPTEIHTLGPDDTPRRRVHVIGIVSGYLPYEDVAISAQSRQPRVSFVENSGLASVVPLDAVHELARPIVREMETSQRDEEETTRDGEPSSGGEGRPSEDSPPPPD